MFKSIGFYRNLKSLKHIKSQNLCPLLIRHLTSDNKSTDDPLSQPKNETNEENVSKEDRLTFAKAFEKFEKLAEESKAPQKPKEPLDTEMFPTLLRFSTFVQMGDPEGKTVIGKIIDIVAEDLYIDFGFKFNAVCKRPKLNQSDYVRGAKVRLKINDLELSDRFLGSSKDMTLLEADATLLGIIWSPTQTTNSKFENEAKNV